MKQINIFIIDDSKLFIEGLKKICQAQNYIKICGYTTDVDGIRYRIKIASPDVILLDIEMPKINGLELLKDELLTLNIPVLVCTSYSDKYIKKTKEYGAFGLIDKRAINKHKCKILKEAIVSVYNKSKNNSLQTKKDTVKRVVAIGSSTGGLEIIENMLLKLPKKTSPIVIVQHMGQDKIESFINRVQPKVNVKLEVVNDTKHLELSTVYFAPFKKHIRVKKIKTDYIVFPMDGDKVSDHKPSIDVLFDSIATNVGKDALAFILTGMGVDGIEGIKKIKNTGGKTYAQDEESCTVFGMPKKAIEIGVIDRVITPDKLSLYITAP